MIKVTVELSGTKKKKLKGEDCIIKASWPLFFAKIIRLTK
jgi:hypothetical protein